MEAEERNLLPLAEVMKKQPLEEEERQHQQLRVSFASLLLCYVQLLLPADRIVRWREKRRSKK